MDGAAPGVSVGRGPQGPSPTPLPQLSVRSRNDIHRSARAGSGRGPRTFQYLVCLPGPASGTVWLTRILSVPRVSIWLITRAAVDRSLILALLMANPWILASPVYKAPTGRTGVASKPAITMIRPPAASTGVAARKSWLPEQSSVHVNPVWCGGRNQVTSIWIMVVDDLACAAGAAPSGVRARGRGQHTCAGGHRGLYDDASDPAAGACDQHRLTRAQLCFPKEPDVRDRRCMERGHRLNV